MTKALGLALLVAALAQGETRVIPAAEIVSRARWGMTQAQLLTAFHGEAGITPIRRVYSFHGAQDRLATVGILFARLEQIPCGVIFLFDDEARLDGIVFVSDPSHAQAYDGFIMTEAVLSGRYGEPTRSVKEASKVGFRSVWFQKDAVWELTYVYPSLILTIDKRIDQTAQSMMADWTELHGPHRLFPGIRSAPQEVLTNPSAPPVKATISNGSPQSSVKEVVYQVDGTSKYVNLILTSESGDKEQSQVKLPFELKFYAKGGQFLYLSAQKARITKRVLHVLGDQDDVVDDGVAGMVHVLIRVSGAVLEEATTNTPYGIATADGKLPD